MEARVDVVVAKVRFPYAFKWMFNVLQVREYHRQYKEEERNTRDVMIVAHGHFSRVLISRWINFPLRLGESTGCFPLKV